jgi:hypothetical protein
MSAASSVASRALALTLIAATLTFAAPSAQAGFDLFTVGGTTSAASITPTIDSFRAAISAPVAARSTGTAAAPSPLSAPFRSMASPTTAAPS